MHELTSSDQQALRPNCTNVNLFQMLLFAMTNVIDQVEATVTMPVAIEKYTELHCKLSIGAFGILLGYNLTMLLLCAIFGYLTRKLPENFNETWYIFVSVATTAFLWLVFIPTYFTAFYAHHQAALLATCLLLNGTITMLCLFVPKLYAIFYIEEKDLKFGQHTTTTVGPTS